MSELPTCVTEYRRSGERVHRRGQPGWRVRVWDYRHATQIERVVYGTVHDAVALRDELLGDLEDSTAPLRPPVTLVADAAVAYLKDFAYKPDGTKRARSSWRRDEAVLRRFVREIGERERLDRITTAQLRAWVANTHHLTTQEPLDGDTRATYAGVIKRLFKWAKRMGHIRTDPAVDLPTAWGTSTARSALVPDLDMVKRLADAMDQVWPATQRAPGGGDVVWLFALTGLRWGEAAAVPPEHVDLQNRLLTVSPTASESGGKRDRRDRGKSDAAHRRLPIVEQAVPLIERLIALDEARWQHWQRDRAVRLELGEELPRNAAHRDERRLLNGPQGGYISYSVWRRKRKEAAELSGVDLDAHELRHIYASLLIAAGADELELARAMGHRNGAYTKKVYGHLFTEELSELQRKASTWLSERL